MIHECVDCIHCANFGCGFRIICLHKELEADAVYDYHPVGSGDAEDCPHFDDFGPLYYLSRKQFDLAQEFSKKKYNDVTCASIREWVKLH